MAEAVPLPADKEIKDLSLQLLQDLGSCPAVPFFEGRVAHCARRYLAGIGLSPETDVYGNLVVHRPGAANRRPDSPPVALVAHMDHPGFEALESTGEGVIARALGGVPKACFTEKVPVQIVLADGGRLHAETAGPYGLEGERMVSLNVEEGPLPAFPTPVILGLPDFHFDGERVHMRAVDDLAGCAAILAALKLLGPDEEAGDVYGVFTRAEEVGLIGARLVAKEGRLPSDTLVVSLEASRTLPGAAIGEGPIIRVGDASFTFDAEAEGVLLKAWEELSEGGAGFKAQRQLMSGGTCEASAFRFHGYQTTGVAFPLGNYHNADPEGGVASEHIHMDDFIGGVKLIVQATRSIAQRRDSHPWRRMRDIPQEYRRRLLETTPSLGPDS